MYRAQLPAVIAKARTLRSALTQPHPVMSRINAKDASGELYIYEMIGAGFFGDGITASSVKDALDKVRGVKALNIYVNSEGGDVFEGKAIHNLLKRFDAEKTLYVDGICASIATHIAMAADRVVTAANATWMIHEAWSLAMGSAKDLRAMADVLEKETLSLAETYVGKTGKKCSLSELQQMMADETWMNAKEALKCGLSDAIGEEPDGDEEEEPDGDEEKRTKNYAHPLAETKPLLSVFAKTPDAYLGKRAANAARIAARDVVVMKLSHRRASPTVPSTPDKSGANRSK